MVLPALTGECKRSRVVALVTGHATEGRAIARQCGLDERQVNGYADLTRLGDQRQIEADYIATPNALHAEQTEAAAAAGKHVFCEKPMAAVADQNPCRPPASGSTRNTRNGGRDSSMPAFSSGERCSCVDTA